MVRHARSSAKGCARVRMKRRGRNLFCAARIMAPSGTGTPEIVCFLRAEGPWPSASARSGPAAVPATLAV